MYDINDIIVAKLDDKDILICQIINHVAAFPKQMFLVNTLKDGYFLHRLVTIDEIIRVATDEEITYFKLCC